MTNIFLVRHGEDTDNAKGILNGHRDTELTELGKEQVYKVVEELKNCKIEVILSSPLKRAYQTASIIAKELGIKEITSDELLKERDFGVLTGRPSTDISKYADQIISTAEDDYFLDTDKAEDFPSLYKRARSWLARVNELYPDNTIVAVTHGDIGKMIRAAYYDWGWERGLRTPNFKNTEILHLHK